MLSYANPSVMRILHIADMVSGSYVCVCVLIHTGMSHSSVSSTAQKVKKKEEAEHIKLLGR